MICWWKFNCAQQLVEGDQTRENIWSPRKQLHDTMLRILARLRLVMVTRMLSNDCVERGYYLSVLTSPSTQIWPSLPASLPHQQQANDHKLFRTTLKNDWEKASIENIKYFHEKIFHWKCWKWKENILQRNLRLQCWTNTDNIAGFRFPPWGWTMAGPWLGAVLSVVTIANIDVKLAQINLFSLGGISLEFGKLHHCYMLRHVG